MKQKFRQLTFVHVSADLGPFMSHFDNDFIGIVKGTYSQLHSGNNINLYSIYKIDGNSITDVISWYYEDQLTEQPNQNRKLAEDMIELYNLR